MSSANERKVCSEDMSEISSNTEHEHLEYFPCRVLKHSCHSETVRKSLAQQFLRVTAYKSTPWWMSSKTPKRSHSSQTKPKIFKEKGTLHAFLKR